MIRHKKFFGTNLISRTAMHKSGNNVENSGEGFLINSFII